MAWEKTRIDLGKVKVGKSVSFIYKYIGIQPIVDIKPGCAGCTKIVSFKDDILKITYTAGAISKHLAQNREHNRNNVIFITYDNGDIETLNFSSKVYK